MAFGSIEPTKRRIKRSFERNKRLARQENNAWLGTGNDYGWEEVPYWLKGYGDMAYILGDKKMIDEAKTWIEAVFKSQRSDGYFGPWIEKNGKPDLWGNMIMLRCLQSYYEYSGDSRVIDLMTKYFKWQLNLPDDRFLKDYWENSRGGDNLLSVYWLYNITGDKFLLDLAEKHIETRQIGSNVPHCLTGIM